MTLSKTTSDSSRSLCFREHRAIILESSHFMLYPLFNLNQSDNTQRRDQWIIQWCLKMNCTVLFLSTIVLLFLICFALSLITLQEKAERWHKKNISICDHSYFYNSGCLMFHLKSKNDEHITACNMHFWCNVLNLLGWEVVFSFFQTKKQFQCHSWKEKKQQSQSPYTTAISRETSGENLKEECVTQLLTPSQKVIFLPISYKTLLEHTGKCMNSTSSILLCCLH